MIQWFLTDDKEEIKVMVIIQNGMLRLKIYSWCAMNVFWEFPVNGKFVRAGPENHKWLLHKLHDGFLWNVNLQ